MTSLSQSPLRRFVADGLRETINSYTTGSLPLHRFVWELHNRLTTLTELTGLPHHRTLATLCTAQRSLAALDRAMRDSGREGLTTEDERAVAAAVRTLRAALNQLDQPDHMGVVRRTPAPVQPTSGLVVSKVRTASM
jgi:hypothetical protein